MFLLEDLFVEFGFLSYKRIIVIKILFFFVVKITEYLLEKFRVIS